jgi:tetratricopeptide (TPR) repeat protein
VVRVGGDVDLLKRFIAAGFPVIVEKGLQQHPKDWMGHYALVSGYDDARQRFITQDSYIMPNLPVAYTDLSDHWWRDFNYIYLVIYPPEDEAQVMQILGPQADETANYQYAAQKSESETQTLSGRDLYFAWFDLGTNRLALGDYAGAAQAYDQAFALYPTISDDERPWRMLWYQVGPYAAYYYTGRYDDVINLGNATLTALGKPILEETFYWMGKAREAQGELDKAIQDYQRAVQLNPESTPAQAELHRLGVAGY